MGLTFSKTAPNYNYLQFGPCQIKGWYIHKGKYHHSTSGTNISQVTYNKNQHRSNINNSNASIDKVSKQWTNTKSERQGTTSTGQPSKDHSSNAQHRSEGKKGSAHSQQRGTVSTSKYQTESHKPHRSERDTARVQKSLNEQQQFMAQDIATQITVSQTASTI